MSIIISKIKNTDYDLEFTFNNEKYLLIFKKYIGCGSTAHVCQYELQLKKNNVVVVSKVIVKQFDDTESYNIEKKIASILKNKFETDIINNNIYDKHIYLFYDDVNECILYNYLGSRLENDILKKMKLKDKLIVIKQLIDQLIVLSEKNIIHNDLKPENIVCDIDNDLNIIDINIIDHGLIYEYPDDYLKNWIFNTTIWSGSPEYLKIANLIDTNKKMDIAIINNDVKDMFFKSQHYSLAGLMIGILLNNMYFYFETVYNMVENNEEHDMIERFKKFDVSTVNKLIQKIRIEFNKYIFNYNSYVFNMIKNIIYNMLEYDHKKRYSLKKISICVQAIIDKT